MQVADKIEELVTNLSSLKPKLISDEKKNDEEFKLLLEKAISDSSESISAINFKSNNDVNLNTNKKPKMKVFMEKIAGCSLEKLYNDPTKDWRQVSAQASELLYGVLGHNNDTRDWALIMQSDDVINAARSETKKMLEPTIDIEKEIDTTGNIKSEYLVLKDNSNNILRSLTGDVDQISELMQNFGVGPRDIPSDIQKQIASTRVDPKLVNFFQDSSPTKRSQDNLQDSLKLEQQDNEDNLRAIASRQLDKISLDELEKL